LPQARDGAARTTSAWIHPHDANTLALQLRNLQSLVEIGVDKNTTVVFPAPLMSTIAELGSFLASEQAAATRVPRPAATRTRCRPRPAEPQMLRDEYVSTACHAGASRCLPETTCVASSPYP
jgi:hypothetical protein